MMKTKDIRNLTVEEISDKHEALKKELFNLRMQAKVGKLEKFSRIRELRKDIARLLTIKNEMLKKSNP